MLKKIVSSCVFILIFSYVFGMNFSYVFGVNLNFSHNYSKTEDWETYLLGFDIQYKEKKGKTSSFFQIKLKDTEKGNSLKIICQQDHDITDTLDWWLGFSYYNDQPLEIEDEIDFKIGMGFYILKEKSMFAERKMKVSYGLIYRDDHFLHSFRFKDSYKFVCLGYKFMLNYILPNGHKYFERLDISFTPYLKIFNLEPSFSYEYQQTHYNSLFETKFSLGVDI